MLSPRCSLRVEQGTRQKNIAFIIGIMAKENVKYRHWVLSNTVKYSTVTNTIDRYPKL